MIKEIENRDNLHKLKNSLEIFFESNDCQDLNCETCRHKRLCDNMYRLDTTLSMRYLRGGKSNEYK